MATISYLLLGTKPVKKIYCRLSVKRGEVYQCPTKYTIHKDDWSKTKKQPILRDEDLKKKRSDLDDLGKKILLRLDEAVSEGVILTNDWLREQVSNNGENQK